MALIQFPVEMSTGWVDIRFWREENTRQAEGLRRADTKLICRVTPNMERAAEQGWNPSPEEQCQFLATWDFVALLLMWIEYYDPGYKEFSNYISFLHGAERWMPYSEYRAERRRR